MDTRLAVIVASLVAGLASPAAAQDLKAIVGATVIGGASVMPDAVIVIEGSRITRVGPRATTTVPPTAAVIDAAGKFVIPGLADMHNHVLSGTLRVQQNLRTNLSVLFASGITTVFNPSVSTAQFAELKTMTASDGVPLPRFLGTGPIVTIKGDLLGAQVGSPTPETPEEARAVVRDLKGAGVDAIKVNRDDISWASSRRVPLMKMDVLTALVSDAHREGLKVFAHAPVLREAKDVLRAGADGLLHGIIDQPVDREIIELMRRNQAVYVPTLSLYEDVADVAAWGRRQSAQGAGGPLSTLADTFTAPDFVQQFTAIFDNTAFTRDRLAIQRDNLKKMFDAKVPVVMGTDSGFFGILMGVSSQLELALMVDAGLTPEAALHAATINAARMVGRDRDYGSLEAGKIADLLILDANPLDDIRNVRRIHRVMKAGIAYDPAELLSGFRVTTRPGPPR